MKGPIARSTVRTSFVLGLRVIVQATTLLLIARLLGPHQFGAFAAVAALAVLLGSISSFGMNLVLLGEVSRESARREIVLAYAVPSTLLCGSVLLAVFLLMCWLVLHQTGVSISVLLAIGVTEIMLQPLFGLPAVEHLALGRTARSQLLTTLPLALRLLAASAVFLLHPADPLFTYGVAYCAASIIALGVATASMPAPWPALRSWRLPNKFELRDAVGYAALNITATSPAELDKTLAAKLLPLESAGVYAAGARVVGAATLPIIAMMLSALPRLFREGHDHSARTARLLRWVFGSTLACSLMLGTLLWFIAPLFDSLFGARYHDLDRMIRVLCLAVPGMALRTAAGAVLVALGRPWIRIAFEAIGVLMLTIAAFALTARYGAAGMPLALACAELGMAGTGWICILAMRRSMTLARAR